MNEDLKTAIRKKLEKDHVTFAELVDLPGWRGDWMWLANENIVVWSGMSEEALEALQDMKVAGEFHFHSASTLIYLIDGCSLRLPIGKRATAYKKPHWMPVWGLVRKKNALRRSK